MAMTSAHVLPLALDLGPERGRTDDLDSRHLDPGVGALSFEGAAHGPGNADEVRVAVHVDDVVEISWTATLG